MATHKYREVIIIDDEEELNDCELRHRRCPSMLLPAAACGAAAAAAGSSRVKASSSL